MAEQKDRRAAWWKPRDEAEEQLLRDAEVATRLAVLRGEDDPHSHMRKARSDRTRLHARHKAEEERAVQQGEWITKRETLIVPAVEAELDARGWIGRYRKPLPAWARGGGRRFGSTTIGGDKRLEISVRLPLAVQKRLERACHFEQEHLVEQLRAFYYRFGDSPAVPEPRTGAQPGDLERRYRDALRAEITTTGDILRAAVDRVIGVIPLAITLSSEDQKALAEVVAREKARSKDWWAARERGLASFHEPDDAKPIYHPDALIQRALLQDLDDRGWTGPYDAIPESPDAPVLADVAPFADRWIHGLAKLTIRLPRYLAERLGRACYWESGPGESLTEAVLQAAIERVIAPAHLTTT